MTRLWRRGLLAALLLALPAPAIAQSPEVGRRIVRHLAVGNISFLNTWEPTIQAGLLFQFSFRKSQVSRDRRGIQIVHPPTWYVHTLASAGYAANTGEGSGGFAGTGQLGVMNRFDGPMTINRMGLVGLASWGPTGYGGALRTEFLNNNAAFSVGYMTFDGPRSDGVIVTLDLLRCILQDLGLVSKCVIP